MDRTLEEFKRQARILGKSVPQNEKKAYAIVNTSFHNAKFSDRIWMYQDMMKAELSNLLQQGLIRGKHPRDLARHLKKLFGVSQYNAERLMITELARVQSEAQKQSFERNGFEYYEYIECGKGDVCNVCKALVEKHFKVKDMMPGENAPPMHPLCHCSIAAWEDNEEKEESKPKYLYKDTIINKTMISSAKYRKKFSDITDDAKISRVLWKSALDMLKHRSGTKYEDLAFIDSKTGKIVTNESCDKESAVSPNKNMTSMLNKAEPYTIIAIHNHPGSSTPSFSDVMACIERKYKYGLIACHDGRIYKYYVNEENFNIPMAVAALDRVLKKGYTEVTRKECMFAGINLEVF